MEGYSYTTQGDRVVKREGEYQARLGSGEHLQQQEKHFHALRHSKSTPEDSSAATGHSLSDFATFLQQSPPRHDRNSFAPARLGPSTLSLLPSLSHPGTRDSSGHRHQLNSHDHQLHHSSSASAFISTSRLMSSDEDSATTIQRQRSSMSDTSSDSPNVTAFKIIAINSQHSPSQPHSHQYSSGRGSSKPARTRTNYKPQASNIGSLTLSQQQQQQRPPARTSRYLREVDRREILRRIEQGEKQANLAKEYQVSRAAISNLKQRRNNRNRKDLLRDRSEADSTVTRQSEETGRGYQQQPDAQQLPQRDSGLYHHQQQQQSGQLTREQNTSDDSGQIGPYRRHQQYLGRGLYSGENYDSGNEHTRSSSPVSSPSVLSLCKLETAAITSPMDQTFDRATEVRTATMELLLARLLDSRLDPRTMQLTKSRIVRLLLETAMSKFPCRELQIPMSNSDPRGTPSYFLGAEFTKATCAVKILVDHDLRSPKVLLKEFQQIEPFSEVGSISFSSNLSRPRPGVALPQNVHESNVLLLVDFLDSQSSDKIAHALQAILRAGIQQRDVLVVTICSHERALRELLEQFLHLRVITAKVLLTQSDSGVSPSGVADLLHSRLCFQQ